MVGLCARLVVCSTLAILVRPGIEQGCHCASASSWQPQRPQLHSQAVHHSVQRRGLNVVLVKVAAVQGHQARGGRALCCGQHLPPIGMQCSHAALQALASLCLPHPLHWHAGRAFWRLTAWQAHSLNDGAHGHLLLGAEPAGRGDVRQPAHVALVGLHWAVKVGAPLIANEAQHLPPVNVPGHAPGVPIAQLQGSIGAGGPHSHIVIPQPQVCWLAPSGKGREGLQGLHHQPQPQGQGIRVAVIPAGQCALQQPQLLPGHCQVLPAAARQLHSRGLQVQRQPAAARGRALLASLDL